MAITPATIPMDHYMVSAKIATPSDPVIGKGCWAIPTRLLKNRRVRPTIQWLGMETQTRMEKLAQRTPQENPQTIMKEFKVAVRQALRDHERKTQPMITRKIDSLTQTLRETINDGSQPEEEIQLVTTHIRKQIRQLVQLTHQYNRDHLVAIDAAEGEKIGKTWSNWHKVKKP